MAEVNIKLTFDNKNEKDKKREVEIAEVELQKYKMKIEIEEIKKLLPHRYPFLFLDWCEITEIGKEGKGFRKFLPEEYF